MSPEIKRRNRRGILAADDQNIVIKVGMRFAVIVEHFGQVFSGNFELPFHVRADSKTAHLPIIMITSRTAEKHRNHALELGVNEYLGKPFQEEDLLAQIARYTAQQEQLH